MKNRPSSSLVSAAWYREPWPWLLFGGPAIVVVASLATAVIAIRSDDGLVAADYYKQGLLVNQRLPKSGLAPPTASTAVTLSAAGELGVRLGGTTVDGEALRVTLTHPASATRESLVLVRNSSGDYTGLLRADARGRWTVTFDSLASQLPTTIVERP